MTILVIFPLMILLMILFATLYHVLFLFLFVFSVEIVNLKKLQKSINEMKRNVYCVSVWVCVCARARICKHLQPWTHIRKSMCNRGHTPTMDAHDCQRPADRW